MKLRRRRPFGELVALLATLGVSGLLGACTSYTGTPAHQVVEWASIATVTSNNQLVVQDIAAIRLSIKKDLIKDVTSNCAGLVFDSGTAYDNLPTPDNTLTDELNVAYVDFTNAGTSCAAATSVHSRRVTAALRTIAAGVVALDRANRRLAAEGVH